MTGFNKGAIAPLDEITPADAPLAGGKAYNCARLAQAGFKVPDALVVLKDATPFDLAELASHPWFDRFPMRARFAVRSSGIGEDGADESFAGIHQTLLDVSRADVPVAVAACRASGRSEPALAYRRARKMSTDDVAMGVLVQVMIQPQAAGVAFTVNPITGATNELVINSSWGVGEALVSGQVDPDEFVLDKRNGALLWSRLGEKGRANGAESASLTPHQVRELADLVTEIERYYGAPQDVEWCHDGREFWIVQSRPVTTKARQSDETEWTRANLAEVLPDVTSPQALDAFEELLNRAERLYLGQLMGSEQDLGSIVKAFHGRLYFNLAQLRHVCALSGVSPAEMLRSMGHADAIHPSAEASPRPTLRTLACAPDLLRIFWSHLRSRHILREHERKTVTLLDRFAADPRGLSDQDLWSVIERWIDEAPDFMQTVLLLGNVLFHETSVRKACVKAGMSYESLVYPQLATGERSVSAQQAFDLVELADVARREPAVVRCLTSDATRWLSIRETLRGTAFVRAFERFIEKYGHRGLYEYDWSLPRYSEEPTPILQAIRAHLLSPPEETTGSARGATALAGRNEDTEAKEAWERFERRLSWLQRRTMLPTVRRSIARIKQYYVWREQVRSDIARVLSAARRWHLVLADRFVQRGWLKNRDEYFLLQLGEIFAIVQGRDSVNGLRAIVERRKAGLARHRAISMPLLTRASDLPRLIRVAGVTSRPSDEAAMTGQPVSTGCVDGEVVVVRGPGDFARMKRGAILVAAATDLSWTPLFTLASGVIVEVGGVLSHASTVAREYGLPALANVKHATKRLKTGDRVRLDAVAGVVHKLQPPGAASPEAFAEVALAS